MTLQDLISSVEVNLGDRASGVIGNVPVATVILAGVNLGLPQCVKLANPTYYDKTATLLLETGSETEFELPPVTINDVAHKIKDIVYVRSSRASDGSPVTIQKVTWSEFMEVTRDYDQQLQGVPAFLAYRENKVYINRIPSEDYTLSFFCEVWPANLSPADLQTSLPIDPEWGLAVEAFTTYYCYLKMQQKTMSEFWMNAYEEQKSINSQVKRKQDIRGQGKGGVIVSGNVWLQPFALNYRTPQG
jgi:hypothetical protein